MLRVLILLGGALLAACGGSGAPEPSAPAPTGSIAFLTRCTIEVDESSCPVMIDWTSVNAAAPQVLLDGAAAATGAAGAATLDVGHGDITVELVDGAAVLASNSIRIRCVGEADWDGSACRQVVDKVVEFAPTPFVEDGDAVFLEVVLYRPRTAGPHPT